MREPPAESEPGGAEDFDVVHARILRFFPDLVTDLGGDAGHLMQRVGIGPASVSGKPPGATYRQMVALLELAADALQCPDFGMRLAALQSGGSIFGPLGLVMKNSRTFGEAIDYVARHTYAHSLAARIWLKRSRLEGTLFVGHDILLDRMPNKSQAMEQILLLGHRAATELTGGHARVRRVHFRHHPISPLRTYRRYFGCEVRFGCNEDGVFYSERDLACPIIESDAQAYQTAIAFIDAAFPRHRPPLHAEIRGVIMQFLGTEHCTNDRIAAALNLHPRTLHRRLKAEGTSFQQIKDEVRRDVMLYYLQQTDLDFTRISERLGFAEQSVMTRCCNRWLSASPSKVRAQARHPAVRSSWIEPRHAYGNTETFTLSTGYPANTSRETADDSHGAPLPGNSVKIVDPLTGDVTPLGARGEIAVKGPTLMLGYLGIPLDETLDDAGYFRTGDGGYLDELGRLHWEGRLNDIIKTGGANVSPVEIDAVIQECPGVKVAQTVGIPHETLGELVVTCIVPHRRDALDEDRVRAFARDRLASYKVPRRVLFFAEHDLPLTGSAKVKTAELRNLVTGWLQAEAACGSGRCAASRNMRTMPNG